MKLHPASGLPDEFEPDEEKMLDDWIEGFRSGRLELEKFVPPDLRHRLHQRLLPRSRGDGSAPEKE
jgi:hypothetical protein